MHSARGGGRGGSGGVGRDGARTRVGASAGGRGRRDAGDRGARQRERRRRHQPQCADEHAERDRVERRIGHRLLHQTGDASARAEAQASGVALLGGAVTADSVRRTATDSGAGVRYGGLVRGLEIDGKAVSSPRAGRQYPLPNGAGYVVVSALGRGLEVTLTSGLNGFPAGTDVVVADVSAHARDGSNPAPTATATPVPTATPTPTPTPQPTATPKPKRPHAPRYKRRLNGTQFVFPVRGTTTIGGPFGAFRADTGSHEGNDLFADFGTPVVAVADGTLAHRRHAADLRQPPVGLRRRRRQFFYAHLSAFSPGGRRRREGQGRHGARLRRQHRRRRADPAAPALRDPPGRRRRRRPAPVPRRAG